jgi:hypothetical protein
MQKQFLGQSSATPTPSIVSTEILDRSMMVRLDTPSPVSQISFVTAIILSLWYTHFKKRHWKSVESLIPRMIRARINLSLRPLISLHGPGSHT